MKKLQNNFTTPEHSKRLLELGLPANSADLFYFDLGDGFVNLPTLVNDDECVWFFDERFLPCWSVGRLIEIIMLCHKQGILFFSSIRIYKTDVLANTLIEYLIKYMPDMDFSKLEE